jgi:hypothetical protein
VTRCAPAPACVALLEEADQRWPDRRRASDGICASSQHTKQNPGSDHEPRVRNGRRSYATAIDLTDDKRAGCDADELAEQLRRRQDVRVKYVIAERRMFSSYAAWGVPAWTWRHYSGPNPHSSHVHVSIQPGAIFDTSPWFDPEPEEDLDVTPEERKWLSTMHHHIAGDADKGARLPRVLRELEELKQRVKALEDDQGEGG